MIDPVNSQNMWTPTDLPPVQHPIKCRPPGRPKKKAKEPNEQTKGNQKGIGISKRCQACGKLGHNKGSCKGEVGGNSTLPGAAGGGPSGMRATTKKVKHFLLIELFLGTFC